MDNLEKLIEESAFSGVGQNICEGGGVKKNRRGDTHGVTKEKGDEARR